MSSPHNRLTIRIYYEDTDAGGVVYHASYLRFAERGRTELLRQLGSTHPQQLQKRQQRFVVARLEIQFFAPSYLDEILQLETTIERLTRLSCVFVQQFSADDRQVAKMRVKVASISQKGRPVPHGFNDHWSPSLVGSRV